MPQASLGPALKGLQNFKTAKMLRLEPKKGLRKGDDADYLFFSSAGSPLKRDTQIELGILRRRRGFFRTLSISGPEQDQHSNGGYNPFKGCFIGSPHALAFADIRILSFPPARFIANLSPLDTKTPNQPERLRNKQQNTIHPNLLGQQPQFSDTFSRLRVCVCRFFQQNFRASPGFGRANRGAGGCH